ncbi:MAG: arylsulfatase [Acidobacteria bacterium]|nr:arylsulfatase [Acidobacteriota bacterium]
MMKNLKLLSFIFIILFAVSGTQVYGQTTSRPNIVLIYADDIGYGDIGAYGASAVRTPNVDRLAKEGIRFTSGYSSSATCTPSRYSMLTGQYAFRKRGTGVLPGDAAMIIEPGRMTLASILRQAGYVTGVVGKWHLGLGETERRINWNGEIKPGPLEIGFDYSFIMAATGDRVPTVYVEGHRVVGLEPGDPIQVDYKQPFPGQKTGITHRGELKMDWSHGHNNSIVNGIGRIGFMTGGNSALWIDEDMADVFTKKALSFIEDQKDKPFFLYFATHDIHVPRVPHPRFKGQTTMGPRGDAIVQFDWSVGEILDTLDRLNLTRNTIVILTSDNGPVIDDGYKDDAVEKLGNHRPSGPFRGGKYSKFEAGTRVPWIVRWPGRVKPGRSDALISQVDLPASFASFTGQALDRQQATDSTDVMPALLGRTKHGRDHIVEHAGTLALRIGKWKYIDPNNGQKMSIQTNTELGNDPQSQLYDLSRDPGEKINLAARYPDRVRAMKQRLDQIKDGLAK